MLSDSIHGACEEIWDAIQNYDYAQEHKEPLIKALTELSFIVHKLDSLEPNMEKKDIKKLILKRWATRNCSGRND